MAIEQVVKFLEASSEDKALRDDLKGIMGVGDGDISSASELDNEEAQALLGHRSVLVATFAEQRGYTFTVAELGAVIGVFQRFKAGELSADDFSRALGLSADSAHTSGQLQSVGDTVGLVYRGVKYVSRKDKGSASSVLEFMKKTAEDAELREELKGILGVGDGDISAFDELDADEKQALSSGRRALVAEFAARKGYEFTLSDLLAVPAKSGDNTLPVIRFIELSASDPALQEKLREILGGDGDISNPAELDEQEATALGSERSVDVVQLGAAHGFRFSVADLNAVIGAFQLVNEGKLPVESCARILGLGSSASSVASVKNPTEWFTAASSASIPRWMVGARCNGHLLAGVTPALLPCCHADKRCPRLIQQRTQPIGFHHRPRGRGMVATITLAAHALGRFLAAPLLKDEGGGGVVGHIAGEIVHGAFDSHPAVIQRGVLCHLLQRVAGCLGGIRNRGLGSSSWSLRRSHGVQCGNSGDARPESHESSKHDFFHSSSNSSEWIRSALTPAL